jgi:hypothetical protein
MENMGNVNRDSGLCHFGYKSPGPSPIDIVGVSGYIVSSVTVVNNFDLGSIWKEAVMT